MGPSASRLDNLHHTTTWNAGLKVRLSQHGLNYGAAIAVDVLAADLRQVNIPSQIGQGHIPVVGLVDYEINHIEITEFVKPTTAVVVKPTGKELMWSLTNAGISIRGDWHIKYRVVFLIEDSGSFEGQVLGASIVVSVALGATPTGQPTISSTGCYCNISGIKMKLYGGASWLYNLFMGNVEKTLRYELQTLLCAEARKAIDELAAAELATLQTKIEVGGQLVLDYGLVANPGFNTGYIETYHRGEFSFVGDTSNVPFRPSPLQNPRSTPQMVTFWISDYVLNSAAYAMHNNGTLRRVVTKNDFSPAVGVVLDLSCCSHCQCIGRYLPAAATMYPRASVEFVLRSTSPPTAIIGTKGVEVTFAGTTILNARKLDGSQSYLLKLKVVASSAAIPSFDGATLRFHIKSMSAKVGVLDSAIGSVSDALLNFVINLIIKNFVLPELNKAGAQGIPLPRIDYVQFVNAGFYLQQNAICLFTDIRYVASEKSEDDIQITRSLTPSTSIELFYEPISSHSLQE